MKKILLVSIICILICLLVGCEDETKTSNNEYPKDIPNAELTRNEELGTTSYKEPEFMEKAGYTLQKDSTLSNVKYSGVMLNDDGNSQIDLKFDDGRLASLLVKKMADYIDENEVQNLQIGDYEVKLKKGLDNIDYYFWTKDDTSYQLSVSSNDEYSNDELLKLIKGFSIKAGDNY